MDSVPKKMFCMSSILRPAGGDDDDDDDEDDDDDDEDDDEATPSSTSACIVIIVFSFLSCCFSFSLSFALSRSLYSAKEMMGE